VSMGKQAAHDRGNRTNQTTGDLGPPAVEIASTGVLLVEVRRGVEQSGSSSGS
jgi:hypothetical protein